MAPTQAAPQPSAVLRNIPERDLLLGGYVDRKTLAKELRVSVRTLDRWFVRREGPPRISPPGRSTLILYKVDQVKAWLDSLAVGPVRPCRTRASRRSHAA